MKENFFRKQEDFDSLLNYLEKELPDFKEFEIIKKQDYKEGSSIYEVSFKCVLNDRLERLSYMIAIDYFYSVQYTREEFKENFVKVAQRTFNNRKKEDNEGETSK